MQLLLVLTINLQSVSSGVIKKKKSTALQKTRKEGQKDKPEQERKIAINQWQQKAVQSSPALLAQHKPPRHEHRE